MLFSFSTKAGDNGHTGNKYVTCEVALRQKLLRPGSTAQLLISLKPMKGIHVNGTPPVEVKLDSTGFIDSVGTPQIPQMKKTGYVDTEKKITINVILSKNLTSSSYPIKGILTYYFCSDAEGWCSRFKQPINLTAEVKN